MTEPTERRAPRGAAAAGAGEHLDIVAAVGGPLGVAESTIPFVVFTAVWLANGKEIGPAAIAAVVVTTVLTGLRLARRETVQFALSGLFGIAIAAFVADRTGDAENFFLPGILTNAGFILAYLTSIVLRKPLLGLLISPLTGEGRAWYRDDARREAYTKASWVWVGVFATRLSIQLPLYITGSVAPLAAARLITGVPLFALAVWLSFLILRELPPAEPDGESDGTQAEEPAPIG